MYRNLVKNLQVAWLDVEAMFQGPERYGYRLLVLETPVINPIIMIILSDYQC
jgi:hypothetical protein